MLKPLPQLLAMYMAMLGTWRFLSTLGKLPVVGVLQILHGELWEEKTHSVWAAALVMRGEQLPKP